MTIKAKLKLKSQRRFNNLSMFDFYSLSQDCAYGPGDYSFYCIISDQNMPCGGKVDYLDNLFDGSSVSMRLHHSHLLRYAFNEHINIKG